MGNGFWAGDSIAQAMESAVAQQQYLADVQKLIGRIKGLKRELEETNTVYDAVCSANAANVGEKMVLREALAKLDPKHPLLINRHLQERIHGIADRAFSFNKSFDDAREAVKNFKY